MQGKGRNSVSKGKGERPLKSFLAMEEAVVLQGFVLYVLVVHEPLLKWNL